jgi:hypothetical protein
MRNLLILIVGLAISVLVVGDLAAKTISVSITQQQVKNVCGREVATGGGHSGCSKSCGKYQCNYDCNNKTGKCEGQCLTCPARKFPFGTQFPASVVNKQLLRSSP